MNSFEARLSAAFGPNKQGGIYLAAVSGGADSTAMLAGLAELRKEAGFVLHCVHIEHGIRPAGESLGDAIAVEALCARWDVPCNVITVPPGRIASYAASTGCGLEAAARVFRHRAWNREARRIGAGLILTAHTQDDQLETILMRVLRGASPGGLAGMPRKRGRVFRPLLDMGRWEVLQYLKDRCIPYRIDSTNADIRFLRNRIRHKLVPLLDELFPSWRKSLLALGETQALVADYIGAEAGKRFPWEEEAGLLKIPEEVFLSAPLILREEAIFSGVDRQMGRSGFSAPGRKPPHRAVPRRAVVRRAAAMDAASPEDLGPVKKQRRKGFVTLETALQPPGERGFSLLLREAGSYTLKGRLICQGNAGLSPRQDLFIRPGKDSGDTISIGQNGFYALYPVVFRDHRSGDRISFDGRKRSLADILDRKAYSGYTGIVNVEDREGLAAIICTNQDGDLFAISRDVQAGAQDFSYIEVSRRPVTGGTDV